MKHELEFRGTKYSLDPMTMRQFTRVWWIEGKIKELADKQDKAETVEEFDKLTAELDALYSQKLSTIFGSSVPNVLRSDLQAEEIEALESFFLLLADGWMKKLKDSSATSTDSV